MKLIAFVTPVSHEASYLSSPGSCRGGDSPENSAGRKYFDHKSCKARCDITVSCTGYVLPKSGHWCETYTSVGATGDGRAGITCYMKTSGMLVISRLYSWYYYYYYYN